MNKGNSTFLDSKAYCCAGIPLSQLNQIHILTSHCPKLRLLQGTFRYLKLYLSTYISKHVWKNYCK